MSDREEREEHIKRLEAALACEEKQSSGKCSKQTCDDNCALLYEQGNWGEWKDTLRYAIESLKTDLKYDLMYEGALEQEPKSEWEHDHEILKAYSDGQASIITVLEAIKAEIEQSRYGLINDGLDVALKIIDKHISEMGDMAEIEPQESEEQTDGNDD